MTTQTCALVHGYIVVTLLFFICFTLFTFNTSCNVADSRATQSVRINNVTDMRAVCKSCDRNDVRMRIAHISD